MKDVLYLFLIIAIGYLIGRVKVKGISLGISAVLLVALVFGHFGYSLPGLIKNLGLACFACAVGYISGPVFFKNFKDTALFYTLLAIIITFMAAVLCVASIELFDLPLALGLGLFSGAVTSTPSLAMALELTNDTLVSVGYGMAYPFGVVGLVLAVQILSKRKDNISGSIKIIKEDEKAEEKGLFEIDKNGMFFYSLALTIGIMIGGINIKLPGGIEFGLGISGGTLVSGLIFGSLGKIGNISTKASSGLLNTMREFGLALFLAAAGVEAGRGFIETLNEYGVILFIIGATITLIPVIIGYILAIRVFKFDSRSSLGALCGSMTSTPALGALSEIDNYQAVAFGYAATYAAALLNVIIIVRVICIIFRV